MIVATLPSVSDLDSYLVYVPIGFDPCLSSSYILPLRNTETLEILKRVSNRKIRRLPANVEL
jgi:hypothetical protein